MDEEVFAALDEVAGEIARRYSARCWWASPEELKQEAWLVAIETYRSYPPPEGAAVVKYARSMAWVACMRQIANYLWRESAPVSETKNNLRTLRGVMRTNIVGDTARLSGAQHADAELTVHLVAATPDPEQQLERRQAVGRETMLARGRLRRRLAEIGAEARRQAGGSGFDDWVRAAGRVLLDGEQPAAVAADMCLPVRVVYDVTCDMKRRMRDDSEVREACLAILEGRDV